MSDASLPERLRDYLALTDAERARTDAEAALRPDLAEEWADARALAALTDSVRQADDLASRVVDEHLSLGPVVADPSADALREEVARLTAEAEDPVAQFERLTGHALSSAAPPHQGDGRSDNRPIRLAADRSAVPRRAPLLRRLAVALVAGVGLYGMAFAGSLLSTPERTRVADVGDIAASYRPMRGPELNDRYAEAVEELRSARQSTLGLFPYYDKARLDAAAEAFAAIATEAPEDQFGKEAALALGRIRLLQGRDEEARTALDAVMAQNRFRAPEAARLLDFLDEQAR